MDKNIKKFFFAVYILWSLTIIYVYFYRNTWPFGHLLNSILSITFMLVSALGAGQKLKTVMGLTMASFLEELSITAGLGIGVLYLLFLFLGAAGQFNSLAAYLLLTLVLLLSGRDLLNWIKDISDKFRKYAGNRFSILGAFFLIVLVGGMLMLFLNSMSLPTDSYSLSSGLGTAKRYILNGSLFYMPYNYLSNLPPAMSVLQTAGLLVYSYSTARMITLVLYLLVVISVYSMTRKFFHRKIALFAATIAASTPVMVRFYISDHPFTGSVFYGFMAFYSFICWSGRQVYSESRMRNWLILSGIFSGLSLNFGFFGLFIPSAILVMILYRVLAKSDNSDKPVNMLVYFLGSFTVSILPLFIRNAVNTGNPFFPFFAGSIGTSPELIDVIPESIWGALYPLWHIPFRNEISIANFYYLGPVFAVFLPGIILIKEVGKTMLYFLLYIGLYSFIYIFAGRQLALIYSLIPVVSIMTGYIIVNLFGQKKYFYQYVIVLFFLTLFINFYMIWPHFNMQESINLVIGFTDGEKYLFDNISGYGTMKFVNEETEKESVIMMLCDSRTFYLERKVIAADRLSQEPFADIANKASDPPAVYRKLIESGVTHLFVNEEEIMKMIKYRSYYWNSNVIAAYRYIAGQKAKRVFSEKGYSVYEL